VNTLASDRDQSLAAVQRISTKKNLGEVTPEIKTKIEALMPAPVLPAVEAPAPVVPVVETPSKTAKSKK
jgi:hypothetical protein